MARTFVANDSVLSTDFKYDDAYMQLILGDKQQALRLLSEYLGKRSSRWKLVSQHPRWTALRNETAFTEIIEAAARR